MAQAAYCSECGENVYVTEGGACPKGHGPERLSNHYEVPESVAAPTAAAASGQGQGNFPPSQVKSKMRWAGSTLFALFIIATLLLGCCVASGWWLFLTDDSSETVETGTPSATQGEETAYLEEVARIEVEVGGAQDDLDASHPATTTETLEVCAEAAGTLNAGYVQAQNLDPDVGREVMHEHFLETLRLLQERGMLLAENGFQELDEVKQKEAEMMLIDAQTEYQLMQDAYELLEPPE